MYIRTTQRQNRDGSIVRYLQLAESVWDPDKQRSQTRIVHNLGREEDLDIEAMRRLARSILRVACPDDLTRLQAEAEALGQPIRIEWAKDYGGLYLLRALWDRLDLGKEILRGGSDKPTAPLLGEAAFLVVANRALAPEIETVFVMPAEEWAYLSSSLIREVVLSGGDVSRFVPESVARALNEKMGYGPISS